MGDKITSLGAKLEKQKQDLKAGQRASRGMCACVRVRCVCRVCVSVRVGCCVMDACVVCSVYMCVLCVHVWCSVMGPCVWYDVCVCLHVMCVVDLCVGWSVCMCVSACL